jgi:lipoyl(octanoyl) transferase
MMTSRAAETGSPEIWCARLGLIDYREALDVQKRLERARIAGELPDALLLLEHPPVYTRGRRTEASELPMGEDWYRAQGIDVVETDRGGRVTYHGPGQVVGYPVVSLVPYGGDVHLYVRRMEQVIIATLRAYGIEACIEPGLTGVWTREQAEPRPGRKIASIGVHVSRGVTRHGFAINVNNDLQPFEWIVPCGIDHCRMTSVARETKSEQDMERFLDVVAREFARVYERRPVNVELQDLLDRTSDPSLREQLAVTA